MKVTIKNKYAVELPDRNIGTISEAAEADIESVIEEIMDYLL